MARYDVYTARGHEGFVVDVQSILLESLNARVVVPLMPPGVAPQAADRLNPVFQIDGNSYVLVTQFLSTVPVSVLGTVVENIELHHVEIVSAVDMLLHGY